MTSQKKMGRPNKENPKKYPVGVKLTYDEYNNFKSYCEENKTTPAGFLRVAIEKVIKK